MEKKNKIDVSLIPEIEMRGLAKAFSEAAQEFFKDPENRRRCEEWKKEQKAREAAKATQADETNKREG